MKSLLLTLFILLGSFTANVLAADYRGTCDINFTASAAFKRVQGTAQCERFRVEKVGDSFRIPVIAVQVADMDTGNSLRDRDMRRMFDRENHPLIFGMPGSNDLVDATKWIRKEVEQMGEISFVLRIRDRVHPIATTVTDLSVSNGQIHATLDFTVSLELFELSPPSFFGLVRLNDEVKVTTRIYLQPIE